MCFFHADAIIVDMKYYEVALTQSRNSAHTVLTYSSDNSYGIGDLVKVTLRGSSDVGVVVHRVAQPKFKTKLISGDLDGLSIPKQLVKLAHWISEYYRTPLGAVFKMMVPRGAETSRRTSVETMEKNQISRHLSVHKLTDDQKQALLEIEMSPDTSLLHGVTGSGKTRLYIELAKKVRKAGLASIVLVPEISLTSQIVADFKNEFGDVFVTHSTMTESERHKTWLKINKSKTPIVIGPRSALFSPITKLGLIVIDECHDNAYKQDNSPRYNTLKVARKLADYHNAKLVLGSATPSITDYYLASNKSGIVRLANPITSHLSRTVSIIDIRSSKGRIFSTEFLEQLTHTLERGEQALIYHNRRGTAPIVLCSKCGWVAECPKCHIPMVLHLDKYSLQCHTCSHSQKLPTSCPDCANTDIIFKGIGTKKLVSELKKLFPKATVARFDTDNKKSETVANRYQEIYDGSIDIIVGTQMIAKGLDLPKLSFGGIVSADTGLSIPDYSSSEKVFQLLHQVIGRVGRHTKSSYVGIQTMSPDNPVIELASRQDYEGYYVWATKQRKLGQYPPYTHLLLLTCSYASRESAHKTAQKARIQIENLKINDLRISGPVASFYERQGTKYRWQLLIRAKSRRNLVKVAQLFESNNKWTIDLDPSSLL